MSQPLPTALWQEITAIARRHGIQKLILFGSRARGTAREDSDIDLAVSGGDFGAFYDDIQENAHTLLTFDIVNLDTTLSDDLKQEIVRDGINMISKFDNFQRALANLGEAIVVEPPYKPIEQVGLTGLFNICFEQCWKMLKEVAINQGVSSERLRSPRSVIKAASELGIIAAADQEQWLDLLDTRNLLVHTYSDDTSLEAIDHIKTIYYPLFCRVQEVVSRDYL